MSTSYKIFVLSFANEVISNKPKYDFNASKQQENQQKLIRTVIYNLDRFDDFDIVIEFFKETLKELYETKDDKEVTEHMEESLYNQGVKLQDLRSYKDLRSFLNTTLQELSTYTNDSIAGKFDRLSVQLKNELRRLSEYDKEKLVKDFGNLTDSIVSKYSPTQQVEDKTIDKTKDQIQTEEKKHVDLPTVDPIKESLQKFKTEFLETINKKFEKFQGVNSKLESLDNKLTAIIEQQTKMSSKIEDLSIKIEKRDKAVKKIKNSLERKAPDEFQQTSEALDSIDKIPQEDELVVSEKDDDGEEIDEKKLEESLTDSIKEFLDK